VTGTTRKVDSFATPTRIAVVNAADVDVDDVAFSRFCEVWGRTFGLDVSPGELGSVDPEAYDAVIFNPGEAGSLDDRFKPIPAVGVRFRLGSPATSVADDALEWITGRGLDGYRWAMRYIMAVGEWPFEIHSYGADRAQVAELRVPTGTGPHPVVVLVHGGGWKALWGKDLMVPLAVDLARRGYASWNLEFRRLGNGGGWPTTFGDMALAIDALTGIADDRNLDLRRVAFAGHSSGAHLALWAAADERAAIRPSLAVSLSGMLDLIESDHRGLIGGENVTAKLLGGSFHDVADRYSMASPLERLPLGVPQVLLQGLDDYIPDLVDMNRKYFEAAKAAGDAVELVELERVDHLRPIDPTSTVWEETVRRIEEHV
jgi:acetyl esterase/lipase